MFDQPPMKSSVLTAAVVLAAQSCCMAVVVISGASNTTAPPGQPYFGNVGIVGGGSAVYLGNRWVLTAAHVAGSLPASAVFGGTTYTTQPGTFNRLHDPATIGGPSPVFTDIVVFRLASDPALPWVEIATATPTVAAGVTMIGAGRQQEASPTYWQVTVLPGAGNDIWTELLPPYTGANAAGFETTATRTARWGENQVSGTGITINYGAGPVTMFTTSFDTGAAVHEAQAVTGDSGGAVFVPHGGGWRLAGMMAAVATYENQPGGADTAVTGNLTAAADLSIYRNEIISITAIPEPAGIFMPAAALGVMWIRRRPHPAR